jgi:type VI protein secretion system component Hcp
MQLTNSNTSHSGTGAGNTVISPLTLVTNVHQQTVAQLGVAVSGTVTPKVTAHYVWPTGSGQPFDHLRYEVEQAQVTSLVIDTASTGTFQETLGFDFQKITWTGQVRAEDGSLGPQYSGEWPPTQHH